jgi:5'-nucleotidase (lipoprotein e(P4) family)
MKSFSVGVFACALAFVAARPCAAAAPLDLVDSLLWQQQAVEYQAIAAQTYRQAGLALERSVRGCDRKHKALSACKPVALEQLGQTPSALSRLRPAVILDLDETALDNSRFQGELQAGGNDYSPATWSKWVEASSQPDARSRFGRLSVPGAAAFTQRAQALGVDVFYVSNRECAPGSETSPSTCPVLAQTMALMQREGFARATDAQAFLLSTGPGDKTPRRQAIVASKHWIAMLVGDDLGDFVGTAVRDDLRAGKPVAQQAHIDAQWGTHWFVLPNPSYGSWERFAAASAICPKAAAPDGELQAGKDCRIAKAEVKDQQVKGFQGQALRVATWNLGWHVSKAEVPPWVAVCSRSYVKNAQTRQWEPVADGTAGAQRGWDIDESRPTIVGDDLSVMPPCAVYDSPAFKTVEVTAVSYARRDEAIGKLVATQIRPDVMAFQEVSGAAAVREILGPQAADYVVCSFEPKYKVQRLAFAWRKEFGEPAEACQDQQAVSLPSLPTTSQVRPAFTVTLNVHGKRIRFLTVHLKSGCVTPLDPGKGRLDQEDGADDPCPLLQQQTEPLEQLVEHAGDGVDGFVVLGDFNRNLWHEENAVAGDEPVRSDGTTDLTTPRAAGVKTRNLLRDVFDGQPASSATLLLAAQCPGDASVVAACEASRTRRLTADETKLLTAKTGLGCRNPAGLDQLLVSRTLASNVGTINKMAIGVSGLSLPSDPQHPEPLLAVSDHCPSVVELRW